MSILKMSYEIALIGMGDWAQRALLPTLQSQSCFKQLTKLHLVARSNYTEVKQRYQDDHRIEIHPHTEIATILQNRSIKIVIIATPLENHYELVKQALIAHKHVFVEKPFVTKVEEAKELFDIAHQKELLLMVGYEFLHDLRFQHLKKLLQHDNFGSIQEIHLSLLNKKSTIPSHQRISVINQLTMHQFSILKALFPTKAFSKITILKAKEKYIELNCHLGEIKVWIESGMDQFENNNFRELKIIGSQKSLTFDFNGTNTLYQLRSIGSNLILNRNEGNLENLNQPPVLSELQAFFNHIEQPHVDFAYAQTMISFVKISQNLSHQYRQLIKEQEDKKIALRQALQQDVFQVAFQSHHYSSKSKLKFGSIQHLTITQKVEKVLSLFKSKPNICAKEVIAITNFTKDELKAIYKIIQSSDIASQQLKQSIYFDYFHLASEFIAKKGFQLTFFVGRNCPYRCDFCPSVSINDNGTRHLKLYPYKKHDLLQEKDICDTLNILEKFQSEGRPISLNISGGLEPLVDIKNVNFILTEAKHRGIKTTLYTNGYLFFSSVAAREVALKSSHTRISLNAIDAKSFKENIGRPEKYYDRLLQGIRQLLSDRKIQNSKTQVALHAVVTPSVIDNIPRLASLAYDLGLDQINYNPDYTSGYTEIESYLIKKHIAYVEKSISSGHFGNLKVNYGGSLLRCNVFPMEQVGFNLNFISNYKVFVDPAGIVTPIHEAGYPRGHSAEEALSTPYRLGRLGAGESLLTVLSRQHHLPTRNPKEMNAFEMIVSSELTRLQRDREFGFGSEYNPFWRPPVQKNLRSEIVSFVPDFSDRTEFVGRFATAPNLE